MANARVARGRRTQVVAAERLKELWPDAESNPASLAGKDILNTPHVAFEVKARRDFNPTAWIRQARKNAAQNETPVVICRPDGVGEESVDDWLVIMRMGDFMEWMAVDE